MPRETGVSLKIKSRNIINAGNNTYEGRLWHVQSSYGEYIELTNIAASTPSHMSANRHAHFPGSRDIAFRRAQRAKQGPKFLELNGHSFSHLAAPTQYDPSQCQDAQCPARYNPPTSHAVRRGPSGPANVGVGAFRATACTERLTRRRASHASGRSASSGGS